MSGKQSGQVEQPGGKLHLSIEGIHCASCVVTVEKALRRIDGVIEATVNLATERASVVYDPAKVHADSLTRAVSDAGYAARVIGEAKAPDAGGSAVHTASGAYRVEGMHCASCVAAVERALRGIDGVEEATVNLATESAHITFNPRKVDIPTISRAVEDAGYRLAVEEDDSGIAHELARDELRITGAKNRMWLVWAFTAPIIVWMIPHMFFGHHFLGHQGYNIGMLMLGAAAVLIPGFQTIRSGWKSGVHLAPNMDALIALGTLASLATGVVAVLHDFGVGPAFANFAGVAGMIMAFHLTGRYIETMAKGRASQAIKRLLTLEAKDTWARKEKGLKGR